ncbi:tyrosine-type recombinase/integrase [Cohnella panacarvi]|uniref:tyrosine-type recombinase/integrase n=1 Tax=Cohnella panacarvi TaxID=400776 RepID=UPI0004787CE7|nr:site-specific integrase [Cohnella panacarvi]
MENNEITPSNNPLQHQINDLVHEETQESFRQNPYFAEKILDPSGMFPTLSDDHDIRKVTREMVEDMLYARQLQPANQNSTEHINLGPQGINQWVWDNKVNIEDGIASLILREYLLLGMNNTPTVFFYKFQLVRDLLKRAAGYYKISTIQVKDEQLLNPDFIIYAIEQPYDHSRASMLFRYLMKKSIESNLLDKNITIKKAPLRKANLHPRILEYRVHLEAKGLSCSHIQNAVCDVNQLLIWLCANFRMFAGTSPDGISILQIGNVHLMAYRTYKMIQVREGHYSLINFSQCIYRIRAFFCYLYERFGFDPPLQRFRAIKAPSYKPRDIPTDQQLEAFFQVVDRYAIDPVREHLGYRLMLDLGLRVSEVSRIRWSDINLETRTIVIRSKKKKNHYLPLAGKLYPLLLQFQKAPTSKYFLMGNQPQSTGHNLYLNYKLYAMIAGWPLPGGVHLFRHLFITRLAQKGILPQTIKELARVSRLDTVGLYMHIAHQDRIMISQINMLNYET